MATTSSYPTQHGKLRPLWNSLWLKAAIVIALVLLASAFAVRWYLLHVERAALPQLQGAITVAGLQSPVTVVRDQHGAPHITAQTVEDLAFAQGYITAQDRLWQMDMIRRVAAGELAEILGAAYIPHDKRQRYLQTRHTAQVAARNLDAATRATLDAYARGVNASMADAGSHLPLEFMLLRYKPRPWTAADTLLAGINMAQMLNQSYPDDLRREQVEARVSPEIYRDLYPASFWRDHPPGSEPAEIKDEVPPPVVVAALKEQAMPDPGGWIRRAGLAVENDGCAECRPGSNDWVVSGEHSTTGKPLLSNDMHLAHSVPGIWYQAQLKLADGSLNVIGVTLPGVPFVIVGHNQRIAWGFTNLGPDVQDLFIENIDQANGNYQTPRGPQPLEIRHEVIQVAKGQSVSFDVQVTRHGPIITPVLEGESRQLALEWTLYDPVNGIRFPFLEINRARNWQEFTAAFSKFSGPGQNVVYADVDGHIGYHATGMVPIRAAGDGTVPVSGADGAHDWTGYIPFDKMPWSYDPPSGILATANNRVTPEHYPYLITTDWGSPYRAERIYQFLRSKPKLSPDDMFTLETDIYSNVEKFFSDRFAYAIDHTPNTDAQMRQAADLLRRWDGRMSINSAAARIETVSRKRLFETLLRSKLGDNYTLYTRWGSTAVLENIVNLQPPRWLPKQYSDWNIFLADQVKTALADAPSDLKHWSYGGYNQLTVQNPVIAAAPLLKTFAGPGTLPQSGSGTTVKQVGPDFGPSERFTADFSDWDHSRLNTVTGESGNFLSPYFMDQWSAWYNNTTFDLPFTDAAVARSTMYKLTLNPGG
ncbi:MAG: penicillin acylase family protein, partial [Acidobacteriaceae bacterium]